MECKKKSKKIWQHINKCTASRSNVGNLKWLDSDGNENLAETDTDKAAVLQQNFSSVYTVEPHGEFDSLSDRIQDIYDKLCNLNTDKSPGLDMIYPRVLFEMRDVIKYPLSLIYKFAVRCITT